MSQNALEHIQRADAAPTFDVLTFIEQHEAEQIAYGIYDVTMTGREVIEGYRPSNGGNLPEGDRTAMLIDVLRQLVEEAHIIRFDAATAVEDWVFRSRIAETVRLLTRLKQRIVGWDSAKARHRVSSGKRLVEDVKFQVAARRVPRRDLPAQTCLHTSLRDTDERRRAVDILIQVITRHLPKLQQMSGFQRRSLESILQAVELEDPRGIERGVVVTASTGAGKTYAFFLPVLAKLVLERCLREQVGVKAICIYPRVALSENQLTDFVEALFHLNQVLLEQHLPPVTIGIESGAAVYQSSDFQRTHQQQRESLARMRGWVYSEEHGGYLAPFAYCVGTSDQACERTPQRLLVNPNQTDVLYCPVCNTRYPFIRFARDMMRQHPPDILIATTESLNRRLLASEYQYLFGTDHFAAPSVIMLDEIHLQTSTAGTQVALLLRRLLGRIRLGKEERGDRSNLAFVGLSATIAQPIQFLADLTGMPVTRISEVRPLDDELEVIGAERFIFVRAEDSEDTAVISTLIQTAMCVLHTMPQPPMGSNLPRYRTFGFVQSLDVVGRWLYQMQDAEKAKSYQVQERRDQRAAGRSVDRLSIRSVPLFWYRYPPLNRQLFPNFFGMQTNTSCNCEHDGPDSNCRFFQAGECWWVLSQRGKALQTPLHIKRKSGSDRATPIEPDDDLIITTSALEVGYDDEALMCVIQYTAPSNVASFVQRKGRGGRKVGTRPIVVTVLSPYKSTDLFLFRNQHLLTEPTFRKLPLNAQNRYLQRIHGFYALFDWLAYRANRAGLALNFDRLNYAGFTYLLEQGADVDVLLAFKDYLRHTFDMSNETLQRVLTEDDGLLVQIFGDGLVKQAYSKLIRDAEPHIITRDILRTHVPENLFSDINLPEVQVDYRPDDRREQKRLNAESISLALSETIPGNVTFRGGQGATWVPPIWIDFDTPLIALTTYYDVEPIRRQPNTVNLPGRALRLVGISPHQTRELSLYRPTAIKPVQFSRDHEHAFWYADPETGQLQEHRDKQQAGQIVQQLAHSTSAFPISASSITEERTTPTRAYTFDPRHPSIALDPLGKELIGQIVLHSDETANMNLLVVHRIIMGSQYTLKFHESVEDERRGVIGFCADEASTTNCALGYEMRTEGLVIDLNPHVFDQLPTSPLIEARQRTSATRHCFITELTVEYSENFFAAEHLADVLLTIVDRWCYGEGGILDGLRSWFSVNNGVFNRRLIETIGDIHQLSEKKAKAVHQLLADDRYLTLFLDTYRDAQPGGRLYQQYLRDTFQYTVLVALKQMAQEVAGVEALNYVAAWTELQADFEGRAADRLWLYEIGMGGIGVMRATHDLLRNAPDRLWAELSHKLTRCPTAQEEALLRHLLAQPEPWLETCEQLVGQVTLAQHAGQREHALEALLGAVRRQLGVPVSPEQTRGLLRVFIPDYVQEVDGQRLINWRIFREINLLFLPYCTRILGREPSFVEARALLYRIIKDSVQSGQPYLYPEVQRLLRLYEEEYGPAPTNPTQRTSFEREVRQAFENAIERRLLLTCRGACPTCLDDRSGEIESPTMARMILSRSLLAAWVDQVRSSQTLRPGPVDDLAQIAEQLQQIFERGSKVAYLRAPGDQLGALCTAISYLTDAGVDTTLGLVYPMITDVQTIFADDSSQRPMIEVTVRPIE